MKRFFYLIFVLGVLFIAACKSNKKINPTPTPTPNDTSATVLDKIKDSVFLYAKEDYLWYTSLPTYATFNPRAFTGGDDITALTNEVNALSQYAINPATNQPYEYYSDDPGEAKYSFIDDGTVSAELNGNRGDFGLGVNFYQTVNDLRITYVYPGSPADSAHIKRGYLVTSVNGSTSISYDGANGPNIAFLNNSFFNSNTISLTLQKPDGSTLTVNNMKIASYTVNPVLKDTIITTANGHKVGYVVFNSFTDTKTNAAPALAPVFANFAAQNITDLVVDLRYNGGGYVSTAEYIDNLIVPAAKTGSVMYKTYYNDILSANKEVLLSKQWRRDPNTQQLYNYGPDYIDYSPTSPYNTTNFAKSGGLNVGRVFFLITGGTASASELTINNLRPVMDVEMIGEQSYGKPVGFFDININKYTLYTPEFYTQNSANQGGYYTGFTPGSNGYAGFAANDDMSKDFGDPTEGLFSHALSYINTGTYSMPTQSVQSINSKYRTLSLAERVSVAKILNGHKFTGMIAHKTMKLKR
ncbi:MAG TPA: S41 family peptidase [Mucilaginibacter sp.]